MQSNIDIWWDYDYWKQEFGKQLKSDPLLFSPEPSQLKNEVKIELSPVKMANNHEPWIRYSPESIATPFLNEQAIEMENIKENRRCNC